MGADGESNSAAADGLHDFHAVANMQVLRGKLTARNDLLVDLQGLLFCS